VFDGKASALPHVFQKEKSYPAGILLPEEGKELFVPDCAVDRVVAFVSPFSVHCDESELPKHADMILQVPHGGDAEASLDLAEMGARIQFDELVYLLLSPGSRLLRHGDQTPGGSFVVGGPWDVVSGFSVVGCCTIVGGSSDVRGCSFVVSGSSACSLRTVSA